MATIDHQVIIRVNRQLVGNPTLRVPALIAAEGESAARRFIEFFTANIRNSNTRQAYARAVGQFAEWCERHGVALPQLSPFLVASYVEELNQRLLAPSIKQHLAAVRMLFDYLVTGQVMPTNPAAPVRGPRHVVTKGKTPVLDADQARHLLDSIDTRTVSGLRDRALIGAMVYSFARVSAVVGMNVGDYWADGKRWWLRLHEKGGRHHEVPVHHRAEEYLDAYLAAARIGEVPKSPLFRSLDRHRQLTERRIARGEVLKMIKRRARHAGLPAVICCHTFRATGITAYLSNGGTLEHAQRIAAHSSPKTTKLYDRTSEEITLDEIERILI